MEGGNILNDEEYIEIVNEKQITNENGIISWFQEKTRDMGRKNVSIHIGLVWHIFYHYPQEPNNER